MAEMRVRWRSRAETGQRCRDGAEMGVFSSIFRFLFIVFGFPFSAAIWVGNGIFRCDSDRKRRFPFSVRRFPPLCVLSEFAEFFAFLAALPLIS